MILSDDINSAIFELVTTLPFVQNLDSIRASVFLDMCYNIGIGNLLQFKEMITFAQSGDWLNASQAGLYSQWARVDVPERAKVLMQRLLTGVL